MNSIYRASGIRKGKHLTAGERAERLREIERIERKRYHDLRFKYHCATPGCGAPLSTLSYSEARVESADAIWNVPVATLTCTAGHVHELRLRL